MRYGKKIAEYKVAQRKGPINTELDFIRLEARICDGGIGNNKEICAKRTYSYHQYRHWNSGE